MRSKRDMAGFNVSTQRRAAISPDGRQVVYLSGNKLWVRALASEQVRALEDTLGVVLFRRTARGLELTPEAEAGLGPLRDGFLQFEEAVRAMQAGQSSKSLTIAAPRDVTEKWLLPKLAVIRAADPEFRLAGTRHCA